MLSILFLAAQLFSAHADVRTLTPSPVFLPCDPVSELLSNKTAGEPTPGFCSYWNPDFTFNGHECCGKPLLRGRKKKLNRCAPQRTGKDYCGEMTAEQKSYIEGAKAGKFGDILSFINQEKGKKGDQAHCTVNNGFLANGRAIVPSEDNRIILKSPERCINFGTDVMVGMLEWLGKEVKKVYPGDTYSKAHIVLGDVAGPRGGCLFGRSGRRGHASHTSGQDADVGFLAIQAGKEAPTQFNTHFDPKTNWWFLKKVFKNPLACIKVIFLDRHHIKTLSKFAQKDEDWLAYRRFIRHMPGHKNHFHVRIGKDSGQPGCGPDAKPELEFEDDGELDELEIENSFLDELKSRQKTSVQK